MEFGLQLHGLELSRLHDVAQTAEALGFTFLTLPDHYRYEGPERSLDPRQINFDPMLEAAVMVQATKQARVGHLVLCNLFRHPLETARAIATLDHMSGGRMVLGIGSGWTASEFEMTGIPYPPIGPRLAQLEESLQCIRSLWTKETTTFDGAYYHLKDAILGPKPLQQPGPPILLGGGGKGLLRIAAKHADIVNVIVETGKAGYIALENVAKLTDEAFRERVAFLHDAARAAGRDPKAIRISNVTFNLMLTDTPAQSLERAQLLASMLQNTPEGIMRSPSALIGTPDEMIAEIERRRRDWGVSQVIFSFQDESVLKRLGETVVAALKDK